MKIISINQTLSKLSLFILLLCMGSSYTSIYGQTPMDQKHFAITPQGGVHVKGLALGLVTNPIQNDIKIEGVNLQLMGTGFFTPIFIADAMEYYIEDFSESALDKEIKVSKERDHIDITGLSISYSGVASKSMNIKGVNLSGVGTISSFSRGVSVALLWNFSAVSHGVSFGAVNNTLEHKGLQLGIVNSTKRSRGFQIGLWNKNEKRSLPFINWNFSKKEDS